MFPSISLLFVLALRADPSSCKRVHVLLTSHSRRRCCESVWIGREIHKFVAHRELILENDPSLTMDARTLSSNSVSPAATQHRLRMHAKQWKRDALLSFQ